MRGTSDVNTLDRAGLVSAALPLAVAIFTFSALYGAATVQLTAPEVVLASAVLVFSGASLFTTSSLVAGGAGLAAVIATVAAVNLRNVLLGMIMRDRLGGSRPRRAALAFLLIDETVGLAVASGDNARRIYVVVGLICYGAHLLGASLGVVVGRAATHPGMAEAVFPVLLVGLAAVTARTRSQQLRAVAAVPIAGALAGLGGPVAGVAPVAAALAAAVPGPRR